MSKSPVVHPTKDEAFDAIKHSLADWAVYTSDRAVVAHGDSLNLVKQMPDDSVSLILTDPPYHSTKKANIVNDRAFREDEAFIEWIEKYTQEWQRVLRSNGTLYVFCSSRMSARLEVMMSHYFRPIAHVVWTKPNEPGCDGWKGKAKKESLRSWYPHSERILVFEHGQYGAMEASRRSPFGEYLRDARKKCGMSMHELTEVTGAYGKVNHGGAVANWEAGRNIPSEEQYNKMRDALIATGKIGEMPTYQDVVRPMSLSNDVEYTDVWDFPSVRPFKGKHPAEKPVDMLEHIIQASTYCNDTVLDCFAGSGSTAVAALKLGRRSISMEIEDKWIKRIVDGIEAASDDIHNSTQEKATQKSNSVSELSLFD